MKQPDRSSIHISAANSRVSATAALLVLLVAAPSYNALGQIVPPVAPAAAPTGKPAPKSSLPKESLERAREAERHLAANAPDQAIAILQELDKKHPNNPALSLRLAEIHDTLNRYGYALVYYRRYIKLAGARTRETAAARVQTLEIMAGVDDDAAAAAKTLGEQTVPVATPTPKVERMLAAARKDGSLVPIRNEEDLANIRTLTAKASESPAPTPTHTPIVIPETLSATPTPVVPAAVAAPGTDAVMTVSTPVTTQAAAFSAPTRRPAATPNISVSANAEPQKPDEDALLAKAFISADSPGTINVETAKTKTPAAGQPSKESAANAKAAPAPGQAHMRSKPAAKPTTVPSLGESVAYTKATPVSDSPRAASFFHITKSNSSHAQVVIMNDLQQAVVTLSIVPNDDRQVLSAILMPGESKTLYVPPASYQVTANASTTDYSPITLMNTQFQYRFEKGRQYTRRVTQDTLQRVN